MSMSKHRGFWHVIDAGRRAGQSRSLVSKLFVRGGTDQDRQLGAITAELGRLSPEQVVKFKIWLDDQMQRANRWDLWCAAYVMCGGCGDDGFEYFRAWLIGQGEDVFERAIEDPETLADLPVVDPMMECEFESLIYVAADVYEQQTGEDLYDHLPRDRSASETAGEPFDEATAAQRFPRIAAKWNHG